MSKQKLSQNESGIASLVIAILIIIVMSTLVLGFLQIISRDQRRSLDRQLSQQAYYAAESGINDATKAVNEQGFTGNKTSCDPTGVGSYAFSAANSNQLDGTNVKYTCLLIDQTPSNIIKNLTTNLVKTFAIDNGASGMDAITFNWKDGASITSPSGSRLPDKSDFPPAGSNFDQWNSVGLVRIDLVPTNTINQSALENSVRSLFLYPNSGSATTSANFSSLTNGDIIPAGCNASSICQVTIPVPTGNYFVRAVAYYQDVSLTVTASNSGTPVSNFKNGQIVVDATGKAGDVTRRIQERIDPSDKLTPDFALVSMDSLCKRFVVKAGSPDTVDDTGLTALDPACAFNP